MTETFKTTGTQLTEACIRDLAWYRQAVKAIQSPAIRKLVESIIAQKTDQLANLKLISNYPGTEVMADLAGGAGSIDAGADPESFLKAITAKENSFAEAIHALAGQTESSEQTNSLNACSERSRKFASWCQDHLDLLGLF